MKTLIQNTGAHTPAASRTERARLHAEFPGTDFGFTGGDRQAPSRPVSCDANTHVPTANPSSWLYVKTFGTKHHSQRAKPT